MKRCPDCNRTFEDTMSFCLVDGSILSAPFEPYAPERPRGRNVEPATTEILSDVPTAADLDSPPQENQEPEPVPPTIASPNSPTPPPETTSSPAQPAPKRLVSPRAAARPPVETTSAAAESLPPPEAGLHSAMKTIVAPPPERLASPERPSSANEAASANYRGRSSGGKWWAVVAVVALAGILIGGTIWFMGRARTGTLAKGGAETPSTKSSANKSGPSGKLFTERINGIEVKLVSVPGGTFVMGSPTSEAGRDQDEGPQNSVTVQSFYMSQYEVTQAQYQAVMSTNPANFKGDDLPVDSVTWDNAVEFCKKLSAKTGRSYRLPTEAEWEFAARAGTTGPRAGDLNAIAWYGGNSESRTHSVGQKQPSGFGLYDMNGNVWEWCQSKYQPYPYKADDGREDLQGNNVRVMRGGSWENTAASCRSAYRRRVIPDVRSVGFRIILPVD